MNEILREYVIEEDESVLHDTDAVIENLQATKLKVIYFSRYNSVQLLILFN